MDWPNAAVLVCLLAAPPALIRTADAQAQPFTLEISAPSTTLKMGAPIRVHVVLTNTSGKAILLSQSPNRSQAELTYKVTVVDASGASVPETKYGAAAHHGGIGGSEQMKALSPGEKLEQDTLIDRQFQFTSPGTYSVQLARAVSDDPSDGYVSSNKIEITLTR
jgi:hypothetical protein